MPLYGLYSSFPHVSDNDATMLKADGVDGFIAVR